MPLDKSTVIFIISWVISYHQFWSSCFYMPLIQRKNSLVNIVLLSVPSPIQDLRGHFQGTTIHLHTSPVDHVQAKRALSQNLSCQSALSFSISHVTEIAYEQTLVHLCQPRAAQAQALSPDDTCSCLTHCLGPPFPTPLLGAALSNPSGSADGMSYPARAGKLTCCFSEQDDSNGTISSSSKRKYPANSQKTCDLSQVLPKALNS